MNKTESLVDTLKLKTIYNCTYHISNQSAKKLSVLPVKKNIN